MILYSLFYVLKLVQHQDSDLDLDALSRLELLILSCLVTPLGFKPRLRGFFQHHVAMTITVVGWTLSLPCFRLGIPYKVSTLGI
nr:MAG TPA: hypothetical protein [Crassvirales sp.]